MLWDDEELAPALPGRQGPLLFAYLALNHGRPVRRDELVSDFLDDGYLDVLRHANRKHDVVAALVTDPRERAFVPAGLVTLEDAETGATRLVDTRSDAYRARVAEDAAYRRQRLEDDLRASGVDLLPIDASGSVVDPLLRFFRGRARAGPWHRHRERWLRGALHLLSCG